MIKVYHNPDFLNYWRTKSVKLEDCVLVAKIHTHDLNAAYQKTQNIDDAWRPEHPCRSTSVGDVMVRDGKAYVVDTFGFKMI